MTATRPQAENATLICRIRGEFNEMPGLCLTMAQAQRLWGIDEPSCRAVVHELIESGFLRRLHDDKFARADGGLSIFPPPRMIKAGRQRAPAGNQATRRVPA